MIAEGVGAATLSGIVFVHCSNAPVTHRFVRRSAIPDQNAACAPDPVLGPFAISRDSPPLLGPQRHNRIHTHSAARRQVARCMRTCRQKLHKCSERQRVEWPCSEQKRAQRHCERNCTCPPCGAPPQRKLETPAENQSHHVGSRRSPGPANPTLL